MYAFVSVMPHAFLGIGAVREDPGCGCWLNGGVALFVRDGAGGRGGRWRMVAGLPGRGGGEGHDVTVPRLTSQCREDQWRVMGWSDGNDGEGWMIRYHGGVQRVVGRIYKWAMSMVGVSEWWREQ